MQYSFDLSPTKRLALTLATELRSAQVSCARHYSGGLLAIEGKYDLGMSKC